LADVGAEPCQSSARLITAAREHARQLLVSQTPPGRLDADLVRREVQRTGSYDPAVIPWAVSFRGNEDLESRLSIWAHRFRERPPTHCGLGFAQGDGRQVLVVVGVRRRVALQAFPARAASGDRLRLEGTLVEGYRTPEVLVTTPLGDVRQRQIMRRSGRFGAWIDFPEPGRRPTAVLSFKGVGRWGQV